MRKELIKHIGLERIKVGFIEIENNIIQDWECIYPPCAKELRSIKSKGYLLMIGDLPKPRLAKFEVEFKDIIAEGGCVLPLVRVEEGTFGFAPKLNRHLISGFGVSFL